MLTVLIGVFAVIVLIAAASNSEWGTFALGLMTLIVLIFMSSCEREQMKARNNRDRYWADKDD